MKSVWLKEQPHAHIGCRLGLGVEPRPWTMSTLTNWAIPINRQPSVRFGCKSFKQRTFSLWLIIKAATERCMWWWSLWLQSYYRDLASVYLDSYLLRISSVVENLECRALCFFIPNIRLCERIANLKFFVQDIKTVAINRRSPFRGAVVLGWLHCPWTLCASQSNQCTQQNCWIVPLLDWELAWSEQSLHVFVPGVPK